MQIQEKLRKLLLQTVIVPAAFILCSVVVFVGLYSKLSSSNQWLEHSNAVVQEVLGLQSDYYRFQSQLRAYVLTREDSYLADLSARTALLDDVERVRLMTLDNQDQNAKISSLKNGFDAWNSYATDIIRLVKTNPREAEQIIRSGVGQRIADDLAEQTSIILLEEERLRRERKETSTRDFQLISFVLLPIVLIFSTLLVFLGRNNLLTLSKNYDQIIGERDRVSLSRERDARMRNLESKVLERVMSGTTFSEQVKELLNFFGDEFRARLGAIFIHEGKNQFKLQEALGFSASKPQAEIFGPNDGLIAHAIRKPQPQLVDGFDKETWRLRSGLINTECQQVALAPFVSNGQIIAIAELGIATKDSEELIDFLVLTSDKIASLMDNAIYKERLEGLYAELQAQAEELQTQSEELQAQQEELRVSNEELQMQAQTLEEQKEQLNIRNANLAASSREISHQKKELERVSRYKSQFLANMSHELRTPLNSSMVLAQLLTENPEGNLTPKQVEMTRQIHKSGNRLLLLINDILDLSKVESGVLEMKRSKFSVDELLQSLFKTFDPMARQKDVKFSAVNSSGIHEMDTDRLRLEQILTNFLSNAVKFTEQGEVKIEVSLEEKKFPGRHLLFSVQDSGIGIANADIDSIFEPFKQLESSHRSGYGGTGLGLSISRQLANLLGARIQVQSNPGQGSTFQLYIPVEYVESIHEDPRILKSSPDSAAVGIPLFSGNVQEVADDRHDMKAGECILVVEDDLEFAKILRDHVRQAGFQCLVATRASEAIELAREHVPSAVILDNQLPDESGLYVLASLREYPETESIRAHFISVADFSQQAKNLGAKEYLLKPVDVSQIKSLIDVIRSTKELVNRRALIVEDDEAQALAVAGAFETQGIQCVHAKSGQAALSYLRGNQPFDCVILDYQLGDMTGLSVLQTLAKEERIEPLPPVVIYTGQVLNKKDEEELRKLTRMIILKGVRSQERLLDEVTEFLEREFAQERAAAKNGGHRKKNLSINGLNILLVDDDMRNIFSLTAALEQQGAHVMMAQNGREAVRLVQEKPEIDFVLMDIMMPEMDGYEAMQRIRNDLGRKDLPIIALTAKGMKNDRDLCLQAGANDYLAKPVDLKKLYALIKIWSTRVT